MTGAHQLQRDSFSVLGPSRCHEWENGQEMSGALCYDAATMIDHLSFYTTDYPTAKAFYGAVLASLGHGLVQEMTATWDPEFPSRRMCAFGPPGKSILWLIEVKTPASPRHVAFSARDRAAVDAFHQTALKSGAKDNGAPGERPHYHPHYYGAFVLDPDGNNIEAVYHGTP